MTHCLQKRMHRTPVFQIPHHKNIQADILYMTRVQRERFADPLEYEKVKNVYILKNAMLSGTRENMRILHPLPRVNEIDVDVDENPKAYYFEQARNGVFARQAILIIALVPNLLLFKFVPKVIAFSISAIPSTLITSNNLSAGI